MIRTLLKGKKQKKAYKGKFLFAPSPVSEQDFGEIADSLEPELANKPVIVSFATRDENYRPCADRLIEACEQLGQDHSIDTIPATSRENACLFKPTFIKFKLLTLGRPLIWLDVDTALKGRLEIPAGNWDLGTLKNNLDSFNECASLLIVFRPTIPALRFLEMWEQLCSAHWLEPGLDHRRFNYTRQFLAGHYSEIDFGPFATGNLIRDIGSDKQHEF